MESLLSAVLFTYSLGPSVCVVSFEKLKGTLKNNVKIKYGNYFNEFSTRRKPSVNNANRFMNLYYKELMLESNLIVKARNEMRGRHFVTLGKP